MTIQSGAIKIVNKGFLSYGLAIGVPQIISFATLLMLSSYLGNELYAKIATFEACLFFLQATIGLAVGRSASRFYIDNGDYIISIASGVVIISSLLLFLISTFAIFYFDLLSVININYKQYVMLYVSSFGYILSSITLVKYQFTDEANKYLILSIFKTSLLFIAVYISILVLGKSVDIFPISHFFVGLLLILTSILINRPRLLISSDFKLIKEMLSYSLPFVPTLIAAWVMSWSNRLFMVNEIPLAEIGLYSIIQRFCMVYFIFTQAASVLLTPIIYRKLKSGLDKQVSNISIKIMIFYLIASIILFLSLSEFLVWYYSYDHNQTLIFVAILMIVNYLSSITAISTNILFNYYKKTMVQMLFYLFVSIISLSFNYYFIPEFKMLGVFISLVVPLVVLNFFHVIYFISSNQYKSLSKVLFIITLMLSFISVVVLTRFDML